MARWYSQMQRDLSVPAIPTEHYANFRTFASLAETIDPYGWGAGARFYLFDRSDEGKGLVLFGSAAGAIYEGYGPRLLGVGSILRLVSDQTDAVLAHHARCVAVLDGAGVLVEGTIPEGTKRVRIFSVK